MSVQRLLLQTLEDLSKYDFEKFKWELVDGGEFKPIPQSHLEDADRMVTVRKMIDTYGEEMAVNNAVEVLREIGNKNAAEKLKNRYAAGGNTAAPSTSTSAAASPAAPVASPAAPVEPPAAPVEPPAAPVAPPAAPVAPPAAPKYTRVVPKYTRVVPKYTRVVPKYTRVASVYTPTAPVYTLTAPVYTPRSIMAQQGSLVFDPNVAGSTTGIYNTQCKRKARKKRVRLAAMAAKQKP